MGKPKKTSRAGRINIERTTEQRIALGREIYAEYAKGIYSLESICKSKKVAISSLYEWTDKYGELGVAKKNAADLLNAPDPVSLKVKARVSLEKLVEGYEYEEKIVDVETTATGAIKGQKIRKITKRVQPDTTAVIFTLKNTDPDNFNRGAVDTNIITGGEITIQSLAAQITPDVLEAAVKARREQFERIRERICKNG